MTRAGMALLVFAGSLVSGLLPSQAHAFSISLSCSTGLCVVSLDTTGVSTPVSIDWDIAGSANIIIPRYCGNKRLCSFYCPDGNDDPTHPVAFPVTVTVVVADAGNQIVGTASAHALCAGQVG
ncbi:hypothetical protein [Dokdonella koreensis]|nr:hypothetical protein [Dokdonella koreensis]